MTDFETHPIGTAKRIAELEAEFAEFKEMHQEIYDSWLRIGAEARASETRIAALEAEMAQSDKARRLADVAADERIAKDTAIAAARIAALEAALTQIAKGEGRFSIDNYEFACNTVEDMKALAKAALNPPWPASAPETGTEHGK